MKNRKATRLGLVLLLATLIALLSFAATQRGLAAAIGAITEDQPTEEKIRQPAQAGYDLSWWSVDGGGGMDNAGDGYTLSGTVGQPDADLLTGDNGYALLGGFWGSGRRSVLPEYSIYLPLVMRNSP